MKRSQLKQIIKEEIQKLNESSNSINGEYLMDQLEDLIKDIKRDEPKAAKGLQYLYDEIHRSHRDEDLEINDVLQFFSDPRGKKYSNDVPSWMIEDLFDQ
jgi:hypothetical protein